MDKHILTYDGSKQTMASVGLLTVAQAFAIIVQAIYLSKAITQMFHGEPWKDVLMSFAIFFIAHVFRQAFQWGKERIAHRFADRTSAHFRGLLVEKIFELGPEAVGKHGSGDLITLTLEGVPKFRKYLELYIPRLVSMAIIPVAIVLFVFPLDWVSGITLVLVLPTLIIFLILIGIVSKNRIDDQMETYRLLSRHFLDSLRGLVTLKYLGKSKSHETAIDTVSNKYRIATNRALKYAFLSSFALDFFASLSVAIVAVFLGFRLINGTVMLEPALAILILAPEYFLPVRELGSDFHATVDGQDAGNEIRGILADTSDREQVDAKVPTWTKDSVLRASNITKLGDEEQQLLKDLSFEVKGNEKIGIVGVSGAGKSTLISVLSGFAQNEKGTFTIDGVEVPHLTTPSWQQQMSYIPQHPTIFSTTMLENLRFYAPNATREEVMEAVERVGLTDLVNELPNGLDEEIGHGGRELSGGEEQRVAVARTLLQKSSVLIFDEPTAHLDIETEHDIKEILVPLLEDKLVFFATHRLHWMKNMDTILVMDQGEIVERGRHEELLAKGGTYATLIEAHRKGGIR